ncbi:thioredoxin domain-containing protein [Roseospirillum parvum]|uniref:Spermatogenesis-associated protein 20-like TRX domain-containing protein n=1 Tax=Roseospirillum parvum TaxID=83401 RepID=A0A1G8DSF8_9PROT|nr:thioredoxin domain-containing protein [Roseospirillum parvum]SDH60525.1 hypothetical protein SAMN05421742_108104 [Roseospirillum parvum]
MSNRLAAETSPYLLQHRDNPVHWHPWDATALAEARRLNRPILLSVGYAACHWCHVMAHESFEDSQIAGLMNDLFVNIKVDREERPDLDAIYQRALAMMEQPGGWPLTMFLTPDGRPFWGGTYFPRQARFGRPGFASVLREIARIYRDSPDKVAHNAAALTDALTRRAHEVGNSAEELNLCPDLLRQAADGLLPHIDPIHGGLAGAPKFPMPHVFGFLWRMYLRQGNADLARAVLTTLDNICQGGIYDHLGGGFARYATDEIWLVPHFEKMLYDNALMIEVLGTVWATTGSPLYAARVAETVDWLTREMLTDSGTFAAALDADSEGEEGRFYVWNAAEIDRALGPRAGAFKTAYDVSSRGNWEGRNILRRNHGPLSEGLRPGGVDPYAADRARLLEIRNGRTPPARDDKVLADWNGLMIAALTRAGLIFERPEWIALATRAFDGVVQLCGRPDNRLAHSYRAGRASATATLDDYANMARAALMLHQATGEARYLNAAEAWVEVANAEFWDPLDGGYFFTAAGADDLIARTKTIADNPVPCGNGTLLHVLAALAHLTGNAVHEDRARRLVDAMGTAALKQFPFSVTFLTGVLALNAPVEAILIGGTPEDRAHLHRRVLTRVPEALILSGTDQAPVPPSHPAAGRTGNGHGVTVHLCRGGTCQPPLHSVEALDAALAGA